MATIIPGKLAFIHIPRTGGMSIRSLMVEHGGIHYGMHTPAKVMKRMVPAYSDIPSFSIIRNPWSLAVSAYLMCRSSAQSFDNFISRTDYDWIWKTPQSIYLLDDDGSQIVQFIGRHEHLAEEWDFIVSMTGLPSKLPEINNTSTCDYHKFYDSRSKAIVEDAHKADIERFGFVF